MKVHELKKERSDVKGQMKALVAKAEAENRELTPEENAAFEDMKSKVASHDSRIAKLEAVQDEPNDIPADANNRSWAPLDCEVRTAPAVHTKEHKYSLCRAIGLAMRGQQVDGMEGEQSKEIAIRSKKNPRGFFMPHTSNLENRNLTTVTGAGSIPTILDKDYIELLRADTVLVQLGARVMRDMHGVFAMPRQSGSAVGQWVTEGASPTGSNQVMDQVLFTPKTIASFTDITRKFILESNVDAESFVKEDLVAVNARAIDYAGINGSGINPVPLGILQDPLTPIVSVGTNGGVPTYANFVQLESLVGQANALKGKLAYLSNAQGRASTKLTPMIGTTYPIFINQNGEVNGHPFVTSQLVPNTLTKGSGTGLSPVIFGDFSQMVLALWSSLDILVDPYTGSSSGTVRINCYQDADIERRHPQAFAAMVDCQF